MLQVHHLQQPIASMSTPGNRRAAQRFQVSLPLSICLCPTNGSPESLTGETRNISGRGVYFITDVASAPGTRLDLSITLLDRQPAWAPTAARFRGCVVRSEPVWQKGVRKIGVAAEIQCFIV
jgi:hypothetical protein